MDAFGSPIISYYSRCTSSTKLAYVNVDAVLYRGVVGTPAPGWRQTALPLTDATADMAWALLFACGRRVVEGDRFVRTRAWQGWGPLQFLGADITGATLGLIGLGRIGKAMVTRASGFDMNVVYWNRTRLEDAEERRMGVTYLPMEEVLASSDYVSIHVALNEQTRHLIAQRESVFESGDY